jgi:hypothetical protein
MPQVNVQSLEVLCCPTMAGGHLAAEIHKRGNLPVAFGRDFVIELTPQDISVNWNAAKALKREVAGAVAAELSHRLSRCQDEDDDAVDHAGEAAACLFLSLHHQGLQPEDAYKGCRVMWDARHHSERVECLMSL